MLPASTLQAPEEPLSGRDEGAGRPAPSFHGM